MPGTVKAVREVSCRLWWEDLGRVKALAVEIISTMTAEIRASGRGNIVCGIAFDW